MLNRSKMRAEGRPEVSINDPHLPMAERPVAKLAHKCTGIFESSAAGECTPIHFQLVSQATIYKRRTLQLNFFQDNILFLYYFCYPSMPTPYY